MSKASLVYFLVAETFVKIGFSTNLRGRVDAVKTGCPEPLSGVWVMQGGRPEESVLHRRFSAHRLAREWFCLDSEIVAFYATFARYYAPGEIPNQASIALPKMDVTIECIHGASFAVPTWANRSEIEHFYESIAASLPPLIPSDYQLSQKRGPQGRGPFYVTTATGISWKLGERDASADQP